MHNVSKLLVGMLILVGVAACGDAALDPHPSKSTDDSDPRPVVALIMKSLANEFFVTMANGARAHQAAHADQYRLIVNGIKNEVDLAEQVGLIDQMIASRVDAIVISPAGSKALVPALARAVDAGIAVINIDNRLDQDILAEYGLEIPFVGPDNFLGAKMVGQYLASRLSEGDEVAILEGVTTAFNAGRRSAGFNEAAAEAGLNVVAQQSAQWDQTKAVTVTSAILVQHPNLVAILCGNDNMALGAAAAVNQAGKRGKIIIVGFDNISAVQNLIRDKTILATVDQHADLLAVFGIESALEALSSTMPIKDKSTPVDLITSESLD